jgi:hypothetical protein
MNLKIIVLIDLFSTENKFIELAALIHKVTYNLASIEIKKIC